MQSSVFVLVAAATVLLGILLWDVSPDRRVVERPDLGLRGSAAQEVARKKNPPSLNLASPTAVVYAVPAAPCGTTGPESYPALNTGIKPKRVNDKHIWPVP